MKKVSSIQKSIFYSKKQSKIFNNTKLNFLITSRLNGFSNGEFSSLNLGAKLGDNPQNVLKNFTLILSHINESRIIKNHNVLMLNQVHSNIIETNANNTIINLNNKNINTNDSNFLNLDSALDLLPKKDGILCDTPQHIAFIKVADCNPILLYDPESNAFVAIHAGRMGVLNNILTNAFNELKQNAESKNLTLDSKKVLMFIGPSIRSCCYEISNDLSKQIANTHGTQHIKKQNLKPHLDLVSILINETKALNIPIENIEIHPSCSCCCKDLFSYRRANLESMQIDSNNTKTDSVKTGRFGLFAWLE